MTERADGIAKVLAFHRAVPVYEEPAGHTLCRCGHRVAFHEGWWDHVAAEVDEYVDVWDRLLVQVEARNGVCPDGPHRGPQGPNEDLAQCPACHMPSWCMRPEGETFGLHIPDCSLPERHESYCQPGGSGHPPAAKVRG